MGLEVALGAISLIAGVASQRKQARLAKKSERAQEKAGQVEQERARIENARRRRQQIRDARIQRGEIIAGSAGMNTLQSSGAQGGAGSVLSQAAGNIADINRSEGLSERRNMFLQEAADAQSDSNRLAANSSMFQSALSVGGSIFRQLPRNVNIPTIQGTTNTNVSQSGVFKPFNPTGQAGRRQDYLL